MFDLIVERAIHFDLRGIVRVAVNKSTGEHFR